MRHRFKKLFRLRNILLLLVISTILWFIINIQYLYDPKKPLNIEYQEIKGSPSAIKLHNNKKYDLICYQNPCEIFFIDHQTMNMKQLSINTNTHSYVNDLYSKFYYNNETQSVHLINYPDENSYSLITIKDDESLQYTNEFIYQYDIQTELKADSIRIQDKIFYPYILKRDQESDIISEKYKNGFRISFSKQFLVNGFTANVMNELSAFMNENLGSFPDRDVYKMQQFSYRYRYYRKFYGDNYKTKTGYFQGDILGMIDCNNDSINDFLLCITDARFLYNRIVCIDGKTKEVIWEKDFIPAIQNKDPLICDIDKDGIEEIFLSFYSPRYELPIDIRERNIFGTTERARFMILDNQGNVKIINDKPALIESNNGFYDFRYLYIEETNKILLGMKSEYETSLKKLFTFDLSENKIDTLDISYQHIINIIEEGKEIIIFGISDNKIIKLVLDRYFNLKKSKEKKIIRNYYKGANLTIDINNKKYYLFKSHPVSMLIDEDFNRVQYLDHQLLSNHKFMIDNYLYSIVNDNNIQKLVRMKFSPNKTINPYIIILFLTEIMLLLFYFLIKQYINIPMPSVNNSYFVQYQILGRLYYWKLYGKHAEMNKQYKRISTNKDSPYKILKELSDDAGLVYYRNFFLLKYKVFEIKSADEFQIIQRISHDLKNQVLMTKLMTEKYEAKLQEENEKFMKNMSSSLREISSSAVMLSKYSHINKLYKEDINAIEFVKSLIRQYINHPLYEKIEFCHSEDNSQRQTSEESLIENTSFDYSSDGDDFAQDDMILTIDKTLFTIAFKNLLNNALEAIDEKGYIKVEISKQKNKIIVTIINSIQFHLQAGEGKGEVIESCFEIGYSTKEEGSGLGIPISRTIIEKHGGTLEIEIKENEFIVKIVL